MSKSTKRTATILLIAVLVFLIIGTVDVILIASSTFRDSVQSGVEIDGLSRLMETQTRNPPQSYSRYESLVGNMELAKNVITYKRLHIDIDPNGVTASYDVYLRKDHPLFFLAERDWSSQAAQSISNEILGAVSVDTELLKFDRVETSIADTDERAHLNLTAAPYRPTTTGYMVRVHAKQENIPLSIASKEVIVYTRGATIRTGSSTSPVS